MRCKDARVYFKNLEKEKRITEKHVKGLRNKINEVNSMINSKNITNYELSIKLNTKLYEIEKKLVNVNKNITQYHKEYGGA